MSKSDLRVRGPQAVIGKYLASGQTNIQAGEPLHSVATSSSGAASDNVYVLAAADTPVVGTHRFGGIALSPSLNAAAGTTLAQFLRCAQPTPNVGLIWGRAETVANMDTLAELVLVLGDYTLIDYNSTGAADGGQLYTIKDVASADTSGLEIVYGTAGMAGNLALGQLAVAVLPNAYRHDFA